VAAVVRHTGSNGRNEAKPVVRRGRTKDLSGYEEPATLNGDML
jgi:hypothetical protein